MGPSTLTLLLHIGSLIGDVKDVEKLVSDLFKKQAVGDDIKQVVTDIAALFAGGLVPMPPGMNTTDVAAAFASLLAAL